MTKVADFDAWLHREAYRVSGDLGLHEDLVQEGRIAMWRDEVKNHQSHSGFMTRAAGLRMREVSRGDGRQFGSEMARVSRSVVPAVSFDQYDRPVEPTQVDLTDRLVLAYHQGEIHQAIDALPPRQRSAARKILSDGVLTARERAAWVDARRKLSAELAHLSDEVT